MSNQEFFPADKNRRFQHFQRRSHDSAPSETSSLSRYSEHDDRVERPSRINVGSGRVYRFTSTGTPRPQRERQNYRWAQIERELDASKVLDDCDLDMVSTVSSLGDLSITDRRDGRVKRVVKRLVDEDRRNRAVIGMFQPSVRDRIGPKLKKYYSWYKITVIRGALIDKNSLLELLVSVIPQTCLSTVKVNPYCYKVAGQDVTFYVDNYQAAFDLGKATGRITDREGEKLIIRVKEASPEINLKDPDEEAIKSVFQKRYNPAVKALDLSKFHEDTSLRVCDIFVPLSKPSVLLDTIRIIGKTIPDLHTLDLSQNKIFSFPSTPVLEHLEDLKTLNLSDNKLYHITCLKNLKDLRIEELFLKGNPVASVSREESGKSIVKELQKIFPKLVRLDGVELPPVISFDTGTPTKLPRVQATFFCDTTHQELVKQFIREYFQIYDSDNRAALMEAYDTNAQFSFTCCFSSHPSSQMGKNQLFSTGKIDDYTMISRNLRKIRLPHQRVNKLFLGKESIVKCLCNLPKTQHDPRSFTVDLTISTPTLVMLSINGVFRERPVISVPVIRTFSRVFVVALSNGRCCIVNELCFAGKPTVPQAKMAFKSEPVAGPSTCISSPSLPALMPPVPTLTVATTVDLETKRQMVLQLARVTAMNLVYSEKCLTETGWNYELALTAFSNHRASLPPEAFIGEGTVIPRFEHLHTSFYGETP